MDSKIGAKLLCLFQKFKLGAGKSVYEKVKKCDLCNGRVFLHLKKFHSREWDSTVMFYKKYPADNPFIHIHKTHNLVQCKKCGLVFVAPRIKGWVVNRWYDEYLSGKYREFIVEYDQSGRERIFHKNLEFIENFDTGGGNLIDIGCASGGFLNIARGRYKTYGIEVSTFAGRKASEYGDVRIGDAAGQLEVFPNGFFDIAISVDSIEHLKSPAAMIRVLSLKMKPGGVVFIDTPNVDAGFDVMSRHFFLFSIGTLSRLLEQNGFQVIFARTTSDVYNPTDTVCLNRFIQVVARKKLPE
jgi:2-polyprenyl-3-methyl-5-hydroxy-6-metoxy-1,4-benzoquinol methylase